MSIIQSLLSNPNRYSAQEIAMGVKDGTIPAFIGIPMAQQRMQQEQRMAAMAQGQQQPTIAQQVMSQALQQHGQMPQQGLPQQPQIPPQVPHQAMMAPPGSQTGPQMQMPPGITANPSNLPAQMAHGGIIAFAAGGDPDDDIDDTGGQDISRNIEMQDYDPLMMRAQAESEQAGQGGPSDEEYQQLADAKAAMGLGAGVAPQGINTLPAVEQASMNFAKRELSSKIGNAPKETHTETSQGIAHTGGSRSWRNNNPGNIEAGPFASSYGATGSDGRYAIFPSYEAGRKANEALLFSGNNYKGLNLTDAIARYAPSNENNTKAYQANILAAVGGQNMPMSSYSPEQRQGILNAIQRQEGFQPATLARGGLASLVKRFDSGGDTSSSAQTNQNAYASAPYSDAITNAPVMSDLMMMNMLRNSLPQQQQMARGGEVQRFGGGGGTWNDWEDEGASYLPEGGLVGALARHIGPIGTYDPSRYLNTTAPAQGVMYEGAGGVGTAQPASSVMYPNSSTAQPVVTPVQTPQQMFNAAGQGRVGSPDVIPGMPGVPPDTMIPGRVGSPDQLPGSPGVDADTTLPKDENGDPVAVGSPYISKMYDLLQKRQSDADESYKQNKNMAILTAAGAMLANKSQYGSVGIGEGLMAGTQALANTNKMHMAEQNAIQTGYLGLAHNAVIEEYRLDAIAQRAKAEGDTTTFRQAQLKLGELNALNNRMRWGAAQSVAASRDKMAGADFMRYAEPLWQQSQEYQGFTQRDDVKNNKNWIQIPKIAAGYLRAHNAWVSNLRQSYMDSQQGGTGGGAQDAEALLGLNRPE